MAIRCWHNTVLLVISITFHNGVNYSWFSQKSELARKADDEKMSVRGNLTNLSSIRKGKRQIVNS